MTARRPNTIRRQRRHQGTGLASVIAIVAILVSCTGDHSDDPPPTVPAAGTAAAPSTPLADTTTPPTTSTPTTTTTLDLPPVATLVPEVAPALLTAVQLDPNDPKNTRLVLPEHLPVLEAHMSAIQANTAVASRWPLDPEAPELVTAPLTPDILARIQRGLRDASTAGEVLDVSQGVTFRPYIVGPVTDTATLYDCEIAGHYWVKADTGELVPPTEIWPAGPGRIVEVGLRVNMVLRDGQWLVDASWIDHGACA